jgi:hypothetical protein
VTTSWLRVSRGREKRKTRKSEKKELSGSARFGGVWRAMADLRALFVLLLRFELAKGRH